MVWSRKSSNEFGRIDILVNNAGVGIGFAPFVDIDERFWDLSMRVMPKGTFLCCKAVAKQMIKQGTGGRIVNISSIDRQGGLTSSRRILRCQARHNRHYQSTRVGSDEARNHSKRCMPGNMRHSFLSISTRYPASTDGDY